jgi:hypothetical protein
VEGAIDVPPKGVKTEWLAFAWEIPKKMTGLCLLRGRQIRSQPIFANKLRWNT